MKPLTSEEKQQLDLLYPYLIDESYIPCNPQTKETLSEDEIKQIVPNLDNLYRKVFRKGAISRFGVGEFVGYIVNPKVYNEPVENRVLALTFREPYEGPEEEEEYEF